MQTTSNASRFGDVEHEVKALLSDAGAQFSNYVRSVPESERSSEECLRLIAQYEAAERRLSAVLRIADCAPHEIGSVLAEHRLNAGLPVRFSAPQDKPRSRLRMATICDAMIERVYTDGRVSVSLWGPGGDCVGLYCLTAGAAAELAIEMGQAVTQRVPVDSRSNEEKGT